MCVSISHSLCLSLTLIYLSHVHLSISGHSLSISKSLLLGMCVGLSLFLCLSLTSIYLSHVRLSQATLCLEHRRKSIIQSEGEPQNRAPVIIGVRDGTNNASNRPGLSLSLSTFSLHSLSSLLERTWHPLGFYILSHLAIIAS